ncbi:pro-neuregulin-4, membrane-bound isoform isoform X10 [Arvicola amphibius]|uniref:pro-neuregulin-4, membrane-bound isoform isoform X10 n=1 Tax=Arvicola amphibius TaxID=1047088 RepID=UPI0018E31CC3|nr:pro-neuregulin-4, membrane-bound isoform isoform X10 [Arvicola amphibius]
MPTDHEEPCGPSLRSFCLNGGICYVIPTIPSPFCRCIENYTGARCEEVFLPSASVQSRSNLSAAFVALAVLVTLTIAALCLLCRSQRSLKARPVKGTIAVTLQRRKANRMVTESPPLNSSPVPKFNSPSPRGPVTTTDVFTSFFPDSSAAVLRSNITRKTKAVKFINRQC